MLKAFLQAVVRAQETLLLFLTVPVWPNGARTPAKAATARVACFRCQFPASGAALFAAIGRARGTDAGSLGGQLSGAAGSRGHAAFLGLCSHRSTAGALPAVPQDTTDPSPRVAANAPNEAWICCTFFSCSWTALLSTPRWQHPR